MSAPPEIPTPDPRTTHLAPAELDLAIPDMDSAQAESAVKALLEKVPGIDAVRLIGRGAWLRYRPATIEHTQILTLLQQGGFRASTFQDSASGETGRCSQ